MDIQFDRDSFDLRMHHTHCVLSILHYFNMEHCAPFYTILPKNMILLKDITNPYIDDNVHRMLARKFFFLTKTRPNLTHVVSVASKFLQNPQETHL